MSLVNPQKQSEFTLFQSILPNGKEETFLWKPPFRANITTYHANLGITHGLKVNGINLTHYLVF